MQNKIQQMWQTAIRVSIHGQRESETKVKQTSVTDNGLSDKPWVLFVFEANKLPSY